MIATAIGAVVAMIPVLVPGMTGAAQYSWFIGMGLALMIYRVWAPHSAATMRSLVR